MASFLEIFKFSVDQDYCFVEENMRSIISKGDTFDDIALITIIGQKKSGKTNFLKCLIDYLNSEVENSILQYSINECSSPFPLIRMFSQPFIFEADGHKSAIFLMEMNGPGHFTEIFSKRVDVFISLILSYSSSVILVVSNIDLFIS